MRREKATDVDEVAVARWSRTKRLRFLLLAAAACWGIVGLIAWFVWAQVFGRA